MHRIKALVLGMLVAVGLFAGQVSVNDETAEAGSNRAVYIGTPRSVR